MNQQEMLLILLSSRGNGRGAAQDEDHGGEMAGTKYDFYLLAHENLYVFKKPATEEKMSEFRDSVKWR